MGIHRLTFGHRSGENTTMQAAAPNLRLLARFRFKRAEAGEAARALELRRLVYAADWPTVSEDAVIDDLDARALHFLAEDAAGVTCAAFRMIPPYARPFDIEHFVRLEDFLPPDRIPAEVGRLCIRHENRSVRSDAALHLGLLKLAYHSAGALGVTDLLLKAAPRLRNLYRVAGFRPVGLVIQHPSYSEEHVMRLDLVALESGRAVSAVARYLVTAEPPGFRS
jgi:predicted GNAT family N-acyltransferase